MNTYLVPTTAAYCYEPYDYIYLVYANTSQEAYEKSCKELQGEYIPQKLHEYESYPFQLYKPDDTATFPFHESKKYDILTEALKNTEGAESYLLNWINNTEEDYQHMDIYDYMYWGDYNAQIQALADKALDEKWSFEEKNDNLILKNYLKYTFNKLQDENKVIETDTYCVFNTGLFSHYYVPIYVYGELNKNTGDNAAKWYFKGFKDEYELGRLDLETKAPERADYFSDPQRLIFNWHNKVIVNYKHILDDLSTNIRLPESIKNSKRPLEDLTGVINTAIQKVIANYKLAIPHYYQDKIQLLIPLYFDNDMPDVALVLDLLKNGDYLATTCLTMEMAYMDARLIAKPESNWLIAENILETE